LHSSRLARIYAHKFADAAGTKQSTKYVDRCDPNEQLTFKAKVHYVLWMQT